MLDAIYCDSKHEGLFDAIIKKKKCFNDLPQKDMLLSLTSSLELCIDMMCKSRFLIVLGFNDTSTLVGHLLSSPRGREIVEEMKERNREERGTGMKM